MVMSRAGHVEPSVCGDVGLEDSSRAWTSKGLYCAFFTREVMARVPPFKKVAT